MPLTTQRTLTDRMYMVAQGGGIAALNLYDDGSADPLPGSPYPCGAGTIGFQASPDGRFLYTPAGLGLGQKVSRHQTFKPEIGTFRVEDDGTLTQVGEPLKLGKFWVPMTTDMSADGKNLYLGVGRAVAALFLGGIMHFRIQDDGTPTPAGKPLKLGRFFNGIVQPKISLDGTKLYAVAALGNTIHTLDIHPDGSLSRPVDSIRSSGTFPINPVYSPNKKFLYIPNERSKSISAYAIGEDGLLSESLSSPYAAGSMVHNPTFSKDGRFAWVANVLDHTIGAYAVRETGELIPLPGSPYPCPIGPMDFAITSDGKWLHVTSSPLNGRRCPVQVTSFAIQPDGTLVRSEHSPVQTGLKFVDGPSVYTFPVSP